MNKKFIGWVLTLIFALTFASISPAHAFRGPRKADPERIITNLTEELGLSETQVSQIRPIIEKQAEQRNSIFEKYASQGRGGRRAMRNEMDTLRQNFETEMAAVLTPEQMEKYRTYREEQRQNRGKRGKPRRF